MYSRRMKPEIIVIAHNIRSIHNVGSIFRTCEGFGVKKIILSGYSPYPKITADTRLPHVYEKMTLALHKTALGAEQLVAFDYTDNLIKTIISLKQAGYRIVGLEQDQTSIMLKKYVAAARTVLLLGEEVEGITSELKAVCDDLIEIPMYGKKESFNVSVATGIALYALSL
jgi:23S rRNA (guanosine2251-2'-O)-methyltransferase